VKKEVSKPCALCNGSGLIKREIEYPDPANLQWCLSCKNGRAKAERVAELVRRSLSERRPLAAQVAF
jgi:hypothetical protein